MAYPLLENVCSDDFKCVSCGNKMYVRVKTSSKSDTKGIRFRYTVVPKGRYCLVVEYIYSGKLLQEGAQYDYRPQLKLCPDLTGNMNG